MANYYIYATDDSGSTGGDEFFNTKGLKNLQVFKKKLQEIQDETRVDQKEDKVVYLHWSHHCTEVNENNVVQRYKDRSGHGCDTLPHTILDWMQANLTENDNIKLLYVVTDGAIDAHRIRRCDHNMTMENVYFYAFNSNTRYIDMSVASMFMCKNKSYNVYCNDKLTDKADLSNPYDYDQITIETLDSKKDELKSYIKLQFLTENSSSQVALDEIEKLKKLRARLFKEMRPTDEKPEAPINLNVKNKEVFISEFKRTKFYKTLMNPKQYDQKQKVESYISTLINYINNDSKSFQFDNLKFAQKFGVDAEEENVLNVNYERAEEIAFPDIILLNETGIPVIMLTHYDLFQKILFNNQPQANTKMSRRKRVRVMARRRKPQAGHFSKFRNTIECPLFMLYDKNFKDSIEYYYNLEAFKSLKTHGTTTGPRTRRPFTGGIVPLEEFDDYNDYILACTYFDGKKVPYNKGLMYYVIWKTCEKLKYIEPNVTEYLKGYVERRISKTICSLALSGVSMNDPLIKVNLTTALWYCVEMSSIIFKNEPKHFTKEKMRMYCNVADFMREIISWFQYRIDKKAVKSRTNVFKYVNKLKRLSRPQDKAMLILNEIFAKKDEFLVADIAHPDNIHKLNYLQMNHKKPIDENLMDSPVDIEKYAHLMNHVEIANVKMCKQTLRPRFVTDGNKSFYEELKKMTSKVTLENDKLILNPVEEIDFTRILSLYRLYTEYVQENAKYPSKTDFEMFVWKKKQFNGTKPVIFPANILDATTYVYQRYEKAVEKINVAKFIKLTKQSLKREDRVAQEKVIGFNLSESLAILKSKDTTTEKSDNDCEMTEAKDL